MKIEKLTKKQIDLTSVYVKKWIDIGLSTEKCDRKKAKENIHDVYKVANLKSPEHFLWMESPLGCFYAYNILQFLNAELTNVRANVMDNVSANVWDNVSANVWANVSANVSANVWDNVMANVSANVRDNVRANVRVNVRASVRDNV